MDIELDVKLSDQELNEYRGKRWAIRRDHGEFGIRRLYHYFEGNATAAAEFLGFKSHDAISREWTKLNLISLGRDKPRTLPSDRRTPEQLHQMLLERSLTPDYAYVYKWDIPYSMTTGRIQSFADIHLGDPNNKYSKLFELVQWVKEREWIRWIAPGDVFNVVTKQSVGSISNEILPLNEALDLAEWLFRPIAWQCIGIGHGNHDARLLRDAGVVYNPVEDLCNRLRVQYLGYSRHMIIEIGNDKIGTEKYTTYYHHGKGAAATKGGKVNAGYSLFNITTAELIITAHNHMEFAGKERRMHISVDDGKIESQIRHIISCPSFLDYGGYAEEKGLQPESTGTIGIELSADKHHIRVFQ